MDHRILPRLLALSVAGFLTACTTSAPQDALPLGESTTLILEGATEPHAEYQFQVKVSKPRAVNVDTAEKRSGGSIRDTEGITQLRCYDITYTYTGSNNEYETIDERLPRPTVTPIDDDGATANTFTNANNTLCGIDPGAGLPGNASDLEKGRTYKDAVVSFTANGSDGLDPGFAATAVRLTTPHGQSTQQTLTWRG